MTDPNIEKIVEACVVGTHAHQVMLALKAKKGDPQCLGTQGLSEARLAELVELHMDLIAEPPRPHSRGKAREGLEPVIVCEALSAEERDALVAERLSAAEAILDAGLALCEKLPVNVFTRRLEERCSQPGAAGPQADRRAVANLYQMVFEIDRDGTTVQEMFRFYIGLGLAVHLGQLGLPSDDATLLATGKELAPRTCACPFDTDAKAWQMVGRKVEMWGEKKRGVVTAADYAREVLARPDIKPHVQKIRALKLRKIAVLGHSFSINMHFSTHASFTGTVEAAFRLEGLKVEMPWWGEGGMTAVRAREAYFEQVLAAKPDAVMFVVRLEGDDNRAAIADMARRCRDAGVRAWTMDRLFPAGTYPWAGDDPELLKAVAKPSGLAVIEVGRLIDEHPSRGEFFSLDGLHMTGVYHKFLAAELLKFIVGARKAEL